jgi:16S rRNA (cytosine1402-N4)-methyltransferase
LLFEQDHGAMMMAVLMGGMGGPHRPVLLKETVGFLAPERGGLFIDGTLGLGGHSQAILEASAESHVLGIDRDLEALEIARNRLKAFGARFRAVHGNFKQIAELAAGERNVQGILVDLGVSSLQFDSEQRGFSFRFNAPLDMRMDANSDEETAAELLARLPEEEIARIIYEYGEERRSRKIARWIVERRDRGDPIQTTNDLAELVVRAAGHRRGDHIHPATRTFQALRIAVNHELEDLDKFVENAVGLLQGGGRFAAISFHSLEDRIIKQGFRRLNGQCTCPPRLPVCVCGAKRVVEILTRRPVIADEEEVNENPRARSAKLRACRKI